MKTPVSIGQTQIELDINMILVEDQSIAALLERAGYDDIDADILDATNIICKPGLRHMTIWSPRRNISSEDAEKSMCAMTAIIDGKPFKGRPTTIAGLISYDVVFCKQLGDSIVVSLGEKLVIGSLNYAVYRYTCGSRRGLDSNHWTDGWNSKCRFLVEFEEVPPAE
jgi:hypothetical protein